MFRDKSVPAQCTRENLALYKDDAMHEPAWYEHPKHGHAVDVVALPIAEHISSRYRLLPINGIPFDKQYKEEVADTAFIVGYPFPDATAFQLPIWKRASIASEPDVDVDQLPKILVDTATRPGLSGSPVVMQRVGLHGLVDGAMVATSLIGTIRNFIGVYSGRIGTDELKAQLGIVWKSRVIDEIVDAAVLGRPPHEA